MTSSETVIISCSIGPYPRPMPQGMLDSMPKVSVRFNSGEEKWYLSGQLHRSGNLPATINCDKTYMTYWVKGIPHRLNGPAIENLVDHSNNKYIIDGEEYEYKNYIVKSRNLKIKNLKLSMLSFIPNIFPRTASICPASAKSVPPPRAPRRDRRRPAS